MQQTCCFVNTQNEIIFNYFYAYYLGKLRVGIITVRANFIKRLGHSQFPSAFCAPKPVIAIPLIFFLFAPFNNHFTNSR
jgi:hypothetical protein